MIAYQNGKEEIDNQLSDQTHEKNKGRERIRADHFY